MAENEIVPRLLQEIPAKHCASNDTRLQWLWNQRLAVVQNIFDKTRDIQSQMTASVVLTSVMASDLGAIELLLRRLEGGAVYDEELLEVDSVPL